MSDTPPPVTEPDAVLGTRPWHNTDNPMEAMYQWVLAQVNALKTPPVPPS